MQIGIKGDSYMFRREEVEKILEQARRIHTKLEINGAIHVANERYNIT